MLNGTMAHMGLRELQERLEEVKEDIGYGEETLSEIRAAITRMTSDLAEDPQVFIATTRKSPHEYAEWRRRAKAALNHKRKDSHHLRNRLKDLRDEEKRLEELISAEQSGYLGDDPERLMSALVRILGQVCRKTGHRMTQEEEGVLRAAKASLGLLDKPFY